MIGAGLEALAHSRDVGVVGLTEVLRELPRIRRVFHHLVGEAEARRPIGAVLIDFPDFNLRLARRLRQLGIPVVYYVSPQIWAWRQGRAKTIADLVERMLVLFDFEVDFYRGYDVRAVHVGHPLVEEVPAELAAAPAREICGAARLALLPGSRNSEVRRLLPGLLAAAARLQESFELETLLIEAPTVERELLDQIVDQAGVAVHRIRDDRLREVAHCDLALCASGTATLEVGLLGTPTIVVYRLAAATYALAKRLVDVPHVALANLVLRERALPELLQGEADPDNVAQVAAELLRSRTARRAMQEKLARLRPALGEPGASARAASEVLDAFHLEDQRCGA